MTKEDKQLLLKDLCARLPHNVVVRCTDGDTDYNCFLTTDILHEIQNGYEYYDYKPYLRPMESMTEEEKKELDDLLFGIGLYHNEELLRYSMEVIDGTGNKQLICVRGGVDADWYNTRHIDYHGLIEKGLALEAPEGMYKTNFNRE